MGNCTNGYEDMDNVKTVMGVLSETQFNTAFPDAVDIYTYNNFLRSVCKYPKFCAEVSSHISSTSSLDEVCKLELSTLFAHIAYETDELQDTHDTSCDVAEGADPSSDCDYFTDSYAASLLWPPADGQQYYSRGALNLRYNPQYGKFSDIAYDGGLNDTQILLDGPGNVTTDGYLAFTSAMWAYMTPVSPRPSMHEVMTGYFLPSTFDVNPGNITANSFGTTTNILTNNNECGSNDGESTGAQARADYFNTYTALLGLDPQSNTGCAEMGNFDDLSASYKPNYFWTKSLNENECQLTPTMTKYQIYSTRDYMRCVCDYWGADTKNCLVGTEHQSDDDGKFATGLVVNLVAAMSTLLVFIVA